MLQQIKISFLNNVVNHFGSILSRIQPLEFGKKMELYKLNDLLLLYSEIFDNNIRGFDQSVQFVVPQGLFKAEDKFINLNADGIK